MENGTPYFVCWVQPVKFKKEITMKAKMFDDLKRLLAEEIVFHSDKREEDALVSKEYKEGFLAGLAHVKFVIENLEKSK